MDDNLKSIIDGLEMVERTKKLLDYAEEKCDDTWNSMLDISNSITPVNRRYCAKEFAKEEILVNILRDIIRPVDHQGPDPIENLYNDLYKDLLW